MKQIAYGSIIMIAAMVLSNSTQARMPSNEDHNNMIYGLGLDVPLRLTTGISNGFDPAKLKRWKENERWIEKTFAKAGFDPDLYAQKEIIELQRAKEEADRAQQDGLRAVEDATAQSEMVQKQAMEQADRAQQDAQRAMENATAQIELVQEQSQGGSGGGGGSGGVSGAGSSYSYTTGVPPPPMAPMAPVTPFPPARRHQSMAMFGGSGRTDKALVIRTTPTDAKTMAASEEDLNIMGRILEKALEKTGDEDDEDQAMGIRVMTMSMGSGHAKRLQIEGYGAVFMLNVNFPLVGPTTKPVDSETAESSNSTWDEAKHEIYGRPAGADEDANADSGKEKFDTKRVERLKDSLVSALKNASNMRNIKGDESVTVVVSSGGGGGNEWFDMTGLQQNMITLKRSLAGISSGRSGPTAVTTTITPDKTGETVLTIRARKSDIDAFAKGKLSPEDFRNKTTVLVY